MEYTTTTQAEYWVLECVVRVLAVNTLKHKYSGQDIHIPFGKYCFVIAAALSSPFTLSAVASLSQELLGAVRTQNSPRAQRFSASVDDCCLISTSLDFGMSSLLPTLSQSPTSSITSVTFSKVSVGSEGDTDRRGQ